MSSSSCAAQTTRRAFPWPRKEGGKATYFTARSGSNIVRYEKPRTTPEENVDDENKSVDISNNEETPKSLFHRQPLDEGPYTGWGKRKKKLIIHK